MAASSPPNAGVPSEGIQYPIRVLFLCTGNSARSQIAEALLTKKGGARFVVASAGTSPAKEVRPEALGALRALGIDWSAAKPKGLECVVEADWDMIITLCDRARESCTNLPNRPESAHWGIPDPSEAADAGRRASAFDDTVALLSWRIDLMLAVRPELLERLVIGGRLTAIASEVPPSRLIPPPGAL